ncbi:alpha/beta hydrolase [Isoptericola sp. b490]|uniref:alpha/beta hydrolase n=1 Tax=Actinotalea lenta TaxID=3064654 RepID=UPI002712CB07|nr:alpha/beta hydrolase [Isoptericola sp. b490]MDO8121558.1 alpha/beta hydrolase [Isoptericola sp. b490]
MRWRAIAAVLAILVVGGCASTGGPETGPTTPTVGNPVVLGLNAAEDNSPVPVVVLVPGGSWTSSDATGLLPLGRWLADRGAVVGVITYRTAADHAFFPVPAQDIACGLAQVVATVRAAGVSVGDVILVGHSAGAQLSALVALTGTRYATGCDAAPVAPDGFVGLSGPYDVVVAGKPADALFGPDDTDPSTWAVGNPMAQVALRPNLPVLLVHGLADETVPVSFTRQFAAALQDAGHPTQVQYLNGGDHMSTIDPDKVGPLISAWFRREGATG